MADGFAGFAPPTQAATPKPGTVPLAGSDPLDFVRGGRIHIKDGSLFIDPYLVLHPRELAPENDAKLREKLALTYSLNGPHFYDTADRGGIAWNLAQLLPISLSARHQQLVKSVNEYNTQVDTGVDTRVQRQIDDRKNPFASIVRESLSKPEQSPELNDALKNGLAMYLLMREKMTQLGYRGKLSDYVPFRQSPDQVLGGLADKIGVPALAIREAAAKGGLEGVSHVLGLAPEYLADVKRLVDKAARQEFSYNLVEHWHLGRQLLGLDASIEEKIAHGAQARINRKITEYRARTGGAYDVPEPVKGEERRVAQALNLVEPVQRVLMHALGYEICFTSDAYADEIAQYRGIYGQHRKTANDNRDIRGTYRIFFSARDSLENSMRTLVHEVAHNLWPDHFSVQQVKAIDTLARSDEALFTRWNTVMNNAEKFESFDKLLRAYRAGNEAEKAAVIANANTLFAADGVKVDAIFPHLTEAMDFKYLVSYAGDVLSVNGARYNKGGYNSPQERFREVISRFAELKQVRLKSNPQLLHALAPGLDDVWEKHYIPHLHQVLSEVQKQQAGQPAAAMPPLAADTAAIAVAPEFVEKARGAIEGTPMTLPTHQSPGQSLPCCGNIVHQGFLDPARGLGNFGNQNVYVAS